MPSFKNNTKNKKRRTTPLPATYSFRSPVASGIKEPSCTAFFKFTVPGATGPPWEVCEFVFDVYESKGCPIVTSRRIVIFISAAVEIPEIMLLLYCFWCCVSVSTAVRVVTVCCHAASVCWQRRGKLLPPVSLRCWSPKYIISLYLVYFRYGVKCCIRRHCRRRVKCCKLCLYRNKS